MVYRYFGVCRECYRFVLFGGSVKAGVRVDIFCQVVDNWGDAGVCWRLARQLADVYGWRSRIWIDVPSVLLPWQEGVGFLAEVMHWSDAVDWENVLPADVVVEGFACVIPEAYIARMRAAVWLPKWFNLEYLSAETWVDSHHLLNSPQAGGLNKVYFFPGFSSATGGLLREPDVFNRRAMVRSRAIDVWAELTGFDVCASLDGHASTLRVVLFGYGGMPLRAWLPVLAAGERSVQLAVCAGSSADAVRLAWHDLGWAWTDEGVQVCGAVRVRLLPMLSQLRFDDLLSSADLNCVRGEDSWVRAIWAGVPLVWDIYKQEDGAHWPKLAAFVDLVAERALNAGGVGRVVACVDNDVGQRYGEGLLESVEIWKRWLWFWNGGDVGVEYSQAHIAILWGDFLRHYDDLYFVFDGLSVGLGERVDLCSALVACCTGIALDAE